VSVVVQFAVLVSKLTADFNLTCYRVGHTGTRQAMSALRILVEIRLLF